MDVTTDQIKREIEEARERISENTSQLGERIRQTFDWRQRVGEHPWAAVGIAAATGFVLGAAGARAFGGGVRAASSYGEPYTYDRIGRDVEAQAPRGAEMERAEAGRPPSGFTRSGAMAGLLAGLGASLEPQLREIGRNVADQLKELSTYFIGESKEAMKQRVERWRSRSQARSGGSPLSSESAGAWPSGSMGGGTAAGVEDTRDTRTPQSRESAGSG